MQEKMCVKSVSDDEKSRLVQEILKSALQSGPLLLEYSSELQQHPVYLFSYLCHYQRYVLECNPNSDT